MKPIIGITCSYDWEKELVTLTRGYYGAISRAGGLPLLLPYVDVEDIPELFSRIDGLLLSGGQDVDPCYFGEEPHTKLGRINPVRDDLEMELVRKAMENQVPVLGICRGIQVMNVAMGGTLYQDLASQWAVGDVINHSQDAPRWYPIHEVLVRPGSLLEKVMGGRQIRVNSFHHQAVKDPAPGFEVVAQTRDGVIEAIASFRHGFALGLQWHPETMWEKDEKMLAPFLGLVEASQKTSHRQK